MNSLALPPTFPNLFAPPGVVVEKLASGGWQLDSPQVLAAYPPCLSALLERWAAQAPDRVFLAERDPAGGFHESTYHETLTAVRALAQALLARGLSATRPLLLLSGNSIDHALLQLAAMHVGIPAVPVSAAYSLLSEDHSQLRYIVELVNPGLVYAQDGNVFARGLAVASAAGAQLLVSRNPGRGEPVLADLQISVPGPAVAAARAQVGPDTVAKILFTSGSTGIPKGVKNTQRMLCANQQAILQLWPFLREHPPVVVDWLPWSHTFGGNHNFNLVLMNGGTLYIDEGKPLPGQIAATVASLRAVSPTLYFNVPRGFDMLLPHLEQDHELSRKFFARLQLIFYAAAALPQNLWDRFLALEARVLGAPRIPLVSAWGTTETAPLATSDYFPSERPGIIGLPAPGCTIQLVPSGSKFELRVRGPNVTPGYFQRDDLTRAAFDEAGFFCTGDAGRLLDPDVPLRGLLFDGRIAENFKLTSGTWVHTSEVRLAAIAAGEPVVQDAVVAGHDRDQVGLLIFPNLEGCRTLCQEGLQAAATELLGRPEIVAHLRRGLGEYNRRHPGNSQRIARILLLTEPPKIDANEITDKGYINQRAVLERRAEWVTRLFAEPQDAAVIILD